MLLVFIGAVLGLAIRRTGHIRRDVRRDQERRQTRPAGTGARPDREPDPLDGRPVGQPFGAVAWRRQRIRADRIGSGTARPVLARGTVRAGGSLHLPRRAPRHHGVGPAPVRRPEVPARPGVRDLRLPPRGHRRRADDPPGHRQRRIADLRSPMNPGHPDQQIQLRRGACSPQSIRPDDARRRHARAVSVLQHSPVACVWRRTRAGRATITVLADVPLAMRPH